MAEGLAGFAHHITAVAYGVIVVCHVLGWKWNKAKRNAFEKRFHHLGLGWALLAIGVDSLAAAKHKRSAEEE